MAKSLRALFIIAFFLISIHSYSQTYNYYYGNLHSHSSYSDGNKDSATTLMTKPGQDYAYAKQSYNFDFLGIAEHNHVSAGMKLANYAQGLYQADTANQNGTFVCMYGMEYGVISNGGHVIVYGVDSLIGWDPGNYKIYSAEYDYTGLWKLIARRPKAFATLAHPQTDDYNSLTTSPYNDTADIAIVGTAVRSGSAFSTTADYTDAPPTSFYYMPTFTSLLALGYKLGPTIDHDNHNTTFGRTAETRTVVLAQALNRDSIMAAYRAMRFYASDDWNIKVNFTINAYPIGSSFTSSTNPTLNVSITDPDAGDNVSSIKVYYGVPGSGINPTVLTSNTNSSSLSYVHNISQGSTYYYYLEITQADGDKVWTSPIWVTKSLSVLPIDAITLNGKQDGNLIKINASFSRKDYISVELERSYRGDDFQAIATGNVLSLASSSSMNFIDATPVPGYQFYRTKCIDRSGQVSYSKVVSVLFEDKSFVLHKIYPNPVSQNLQLFISAQKGISSGINIYDAAGRLVLVSSKQLSTGDNFVRLDVHSFSKGLYHVVIKLNSMELESSFIKQ